MKKYEVVDIKKYLFSLFLCVIAITYFYVIMGHSVVKAETRTETELNNGVIKESEKLIVETTVLLQANKDIKIRIQNISENVEKVWQKSEKKMVVNIDASVFSQESIRLNTEIYKEAEEVINVEHIIGEYGKPKTTLYGSFLEYVNPLIPIALTTCETQSWSDSRYSWSSAIYTRLLKNKNVNMSKLHVNRINTDTYVVNDLCLYLGCGMNCTAATNSHYHVLGRNDNDSLGPLQILRRYVEPEGISYSCGESVTDLMCWRDNLEYFLHTQSENYSNNGHWNKEHIIKSEYELVALMAVAHNTGNAFQMASGGDGKAGSLWKDSQSVFDFCEKIGSRDSVRVLEEYIEEWYGYAVECEKGSKQFSLAGNTLQNKYDELLSRMGINKSNYASSFNYKQYYPLKAVLNYMSLERLYKSGNYSVEN